MHLRLSASFLALVLFWLPGCYSISNYNGDGVLTRTKSGSSIYKLNLGSVQLSSEQRASYRLAALPHQEFTVGLEVEGHSPGPSSIFDTKPLTAEVSIRLVNERHEVVIDETDSLKNWVWSGALGIPNRSFIYRRGETRDIPDDTGAVRIELVDKRPDEGWGTYFVPRRDAVYELQFTVITKDAAASRFEIEVVAYGGVPIVF